MLETSILLTLILGCMLPVHVHALTCYGMEGDQMNSNYVPCNASASVDAATDRTHSACCNAANADICLSSGLCLSTVAVALGRVLWVNGCTDKTLQDPSCPQYCRNMKNPPGPSDAYFLRSCDRNETTNSWCCGVEGQNISECCKRSFKLRSNIGHLVQQLSVADSGGSGGGSGRGNNDNTNNGVPFITPSSFDSQPPSTATSSRATNLSTTASNNREGLIAGISVVSAIAAVAIIALIVAILRIRRFSRRNQNLSSSAGQAQDNDAANIAPQVVERPGTPLSPSNLPLAERTAITNTSAAHELSPVSARSEPCEISETTGESSALRSLATDGPATRSTVMIAELPADAVVKGE